MPEPNPVASSAYRLIILVGSAIAAALAAPALVRGGTSGGEPTAELRLMSFNVRVDSGSTACPNGWLCPSAPRRDKALVVINGFGPDVLGVQEALINQVNDLQNGLSGYDFYGVGRDDGYLGGEFCGIYYRSDRFAHADQGTFWLSYTPDVPGSIFPGAACRRIASWVRLCDAATGQAYFVLNTHWDHVSQDARFYSAQLIRQKIDELSGGLPVVVMGDLNATEDNPAYLEMIGTNDPGGLQLLDAYREVFPVRQPDEATSHGFTGNPYGSRIDHVLHAEFFLAVDASIDRTDFSGTYPSDHFPVTATFHVFETSPTLEVVPSSFARSVVRGHDLPNDTFTVADRDGGCLMSYTITDDVDWLSVYPAGGASFGEIDTITIIYDTASLSVDSHVATITIDAPRAANTPQEITVNVTVSIPGDVDQDGDVDQEDFGHLQACLSGPGAAQGDPACARTLLDDDEDVDQDDLSILLNCISGPNVPANPSCSIPSGRAAGRDAVMR